MKKVSTVFMGLAATMLAPMALAEDLYIPANHTNPDIQILNGGKFDYVNLLISNTARETVVALGEVDFGSDGSAYKSVYVSLGRGWGDATGNIVLCYGDDAESATEFVSIPVWIKDLSYQVGRPFGVNLEEGAVSGKQKVWLKYDGFNDNLIGVGFNESKVYGEADYVQEGDKDGWWNVDARSFGKRLRYPTQHPDYADKKVVLVASDFTKIAPEGDTPRIDTANDSWGWIQADGIIEATDVDFGTLNIEQVALLTRADGENDINKYMEVYIDDAKVASLYAGRQITNNGFLPIVATLAEPIQGGTHTVQIKWIVGGPNLYSVEFFEGTPWIESTTPDPITKAVDVTADDLTPGYLTFDFAGSNMTADAPEKDNQGNNKTPEQMMRVYGDWACSVLRSGQWEGDNVGYTKNGSVLRLTAADGSAFDFGETLYDRIVVRHATDKADFRGPVEESNFSFYADLETEENGGTINWNDEAAAKARIAEHTPVAMVRMQGSGGWGIVKGVRGDADYITGEHTLYIVYNSNDGANVKQIYFEPMVGTPEIQIADAKVSNFQTTSADIVVSYDTTDVADRMKVYAIVSEVADEAEPIKVEATGSPVTISLSDLAQNAKLEYSVVMQVESAHGYKIAASEAANVSISTFEAVSDYDYIAVNHQNPDVEIVAGSGKFNPMNLLLGDVSSDLVVCLGEVDFDSNDYKAAFVDFANGWDGMPEGNVVLSAGADADSAEPFAIIPVNFYHTYYFPRRFGQNIVEGEGLTVPTGKQNVYASFDGCTGNLFGFGFAKQAFNEVDYVHDGDKAYDGDWTNAKDNGIRLLWPSEDARYAASSVVVPGADFEFSAGEDGQGGIDGDGSIGWTGDGLTMVTKEAVDFGEGDFNQVVVYAKASDWQFQQNANKFLEIYVDEATDANLIGRVWMGWEAFRYVPVVCEMSQTVSGEHKILIKWIGGGATNVLSVGLYGNATWAVTQIPDAEVITPVDDQPVEDAVHFVNFRDGTTDGKSRTADTWKCDILTTQNDPRFEGNGNVGYTTKGTILRFTAPDGNAYDFGQTTIEHMVVMHACDKSWTDFIHNSNFAFYTDLEEGRTIDDWNNTAAVVEGQTPVAMVRLQGTGNWGNVYGVRGDVTGDLTGEHKLYMVYNTPDQGTGANVFDIYLELGEPSGVGVVEATDATAMVKAVAGAIEVTNGDTTKVMIYTANGQTVATATLHAKGVTAFPVAAGFYLVKTIDAAGNASVVKLAVK